MQALLTRLRDGAWLTGERLRVYAGMMLAATVLGVIVMFARSDGLAGPDGQPVGTDFSNVYAAGRLVLEGRAADAYDWTLHHAAEQAVFGPQTPYYGWHYPPMFLLLAALLATLPYLAALIAWQAATFALYLAALRPILTGYRGWILPAAAFPAVLINFGHGQNGFLTAALIGGGLALLPGRPLFAGMLLGALCYKPQFAALVPLALLAGGYWRSLAAAAATAALLCALSTILFGPTIWTAFLHGSELTRSIVLEEGSTGWFKIQSAFSAARNWGAGIALAYFVQAVVSLVAAGLAIRHWRSAAAFEDKAAILIVAALAATPYSLDYDMMVLAPALAFLAARGLRAGFRPYEITVLVCVWALPLVARIVMKATTLPLGAASLVALMLFCAGTLRRAPAPAPEALSSI